MQPFQRKTLIDCFLGKANSFENGQAAIVFNQKKGSNARKEFEEKMLGKSSSQIKAYWAKRIFSGKGRPPKELASDAEIIAKIAADETVISYIDAKNVTDGVKVIKKM